MPDQTDLLQGTLDLLILKTLALEPMHGWGISQRIQQISQDVLQVGQGSLYPALHRLERRGWISSEWSTSDNNRKARYYAITRAGRKQLEKEQEEWERLTRAISLILRHA
jgi:transcriptional regulator